ncbi:MAG: polysaccharide deacetylase family protein [Candidatus Hydrogenedentota bacterium]
MNSRRILLAAVVTYCAARVFAAESVPDKTVVLTLDDAVKSQVTFVAPLLREYGFGATFFITHRWMDDPAHFMSWDDVAELHRLGFEIGNHSWTHADFGSPKNAARLAGELALVERELTQVGVPKPVSFAWCGNSFGPEALAILRAAGYMLARRGMQPEVKYGEIVPGPLYEPTSHDPLLIPTSGDAYPDWTLEHFKRVVDRARDGKIVVLQFHGVPDEAHPWVHTPPERFREYMAYLKQENFRVIALRDVERFIDFDARRNDPVALLRHPARDADKLELPVEMAATRENIGAWMQNMAAHRYTAEEVAKVSGYSVAESQQLLEKARANSVDSPSAGSVRIVPYPGGRHPRIGFLDGAIDPQRGTKVSVFAPWRGGGYVVVDLPEAIFSNLGLTFLAHTHIPTIWDASNTVIENVDWQTRTDGGLEFTRELPNGIRFGGTVMGKGNGADFGLWLENGTDAPLTRLRTQVCAMLKGADGFAAQSNERKIFRPPFAAAPSHDGKRWVITAFDRCGRAWGNGDCPCVHADPVLPDAAPGERVEAHGRIWFYEGTDIESELKRAGAQFAGS